MGIFFRRCDISPPRQLIDTFSGWIRETKIIGDFNCIKIAFIRFCNCVCQFVCRSIVPRLIFRLKSMLGEFAIPNLSLICICLSELVNNSVWYRSFYYKIIVEFMISLINKGDFIVEKLIFSGYYFKFCFKILWFIKNQLIIFWPFDNLDLCSYGQILSLLVKMVSFSISH